MTRAERLGRLTDCVAILKQHKNHPAALAEFKRLVEDMPQEERVELRDTLKQMISEAK